MAHESRLRAWRFTTHKGLVSIGHPEVPGARFLVGHALRLGAQSFRVVPPTLPRGGDHQFGGATWQADALARSAPLAINVKHTSNSPKHIARTHDS